MEDKCVLLLSESSPEVSKLQVVLEFIGQQSQIIELQSLEKYRSKPASISFFVISLKSYAHELDQVLANLQQHFPMTAVVLLKDNQRNVSAEYLYDCITLPYQQAQLLQIIHRCESKGASEPAIPNQVKMREMAELIVGSSKKIEKIRELISQVATSDANVLILGESGTGKEVVAKCIHTWSNRHCNSFVPVNCGAIPSELLESELFGHEKGAFTGALSARKGRFELASGGTIFLDEIGDMPLAMQVKLLRVIQERLIERVGSNTSLDIDVRIIAATHRDLEQAIERGDFREDLFYRLNVFPIEMPTVRERIEDLPQLINDIVKRFSQQQNCTLNFSEDTLSVLQNYSWPGNIRELGNLVERLMVLFPNGEVRVKDLPPRYRLDHLADDFDDGHNHSRSEVHQPQSHPALTGELSKNNKVDLKEHLMNTELAFIKQALEQSDGVVARAADLLNIRRTTLVEKMRKYRLNREEFETGRETTS